MNSARRPHHAPCARRARITNMKVQATRPRSTHAWSPATTRWHYSLQRPFLTLTPMTKRSPNATRPRYNQGRRKSKTASATHKTSPPNSMSIANTLFFLCVSDSSHTLYTSFDEPLRTPDMRAPSRITATKNTRFFHRSTKHTFCRGAGAHCYY